MGSRLSASTLLLAVALAGCSHAVDTDPNQDGGQTDGGTLGCSTCLDTDSGAPLSAIPIAQPGDSIQLFGRLEATDPKWERPTEECSAGSPGHHFEPFAIVNESGVARTLNVTARWAGDGFLHAFRSPFSPLDPLPGCIAGNDDLDGLTTQSGFVELAIPAGATLVLVASSHEPADPIGTFTIEVETGGETGTCGNATVDAGAACDDAQDAGSGDAGEDAVVEDDGGPDGDFVDGGGLAECPGNYQPPPGTTIIKIGDADNYEGRDFDVVFDNPGSTFDSAVAVSEIKALEFTNNQFRAGSISTAPGNFGPPTYKDWSLSACPGDFRGDLPDECSRVRRGSVRMDYSIDGSHGCVIPVGVPVYLNIRANQSNETSGFVMQNLVLEQLP